MTNCVCDGKYSKMYDNSGVIKSEIGYDHFRLDTWCPKRESSAGKLTADCEGADKTQKALNLVFSFLSHRSHRKLNSISVVAYIYNSFGQVKIFK